MLTVCIIHGAKEFAVGQTLLLALTLLCRGDMQEQFHICSINK